MRLALYYTPPPDSPLGELGRRWFTRPGAAPLTAQPRLYGFHATLKAPFRLAEERRQKELEAALDEFCRTRPPVAIGSLLLADLDGFLALVPERQTNELEALAADCVTGFDRFRAAPGDGEIARRRASGLSPRQDRYLLAWGYPYVLEEFRFHMTLTRRLTAEESAAARSELAALAKSLASEPAALDAISLCVQPAEGKAFEVRERIPLSG